MNLPLDPAVIYLLERQIKDELGRRRARKEQGKRGGLIKFVRYFWHVLEPHTKLVEGWPLEALCLHLEAMAFGDIEPRRLLINVPPGFMKSLLCNVFFPAWVWGPLNQPHKRFLAFSYAAPLTERDNGYLRDLILSPEYQAVYSDRFKLRTVGVTRLETDKTGWKQASSVGGVGTGVRGDMILLDDPHNVKEAESDTVREDTVRWFRETMENRLNDLEKSSVVVIMQRVHQADVSGAILEEDTGYEHLMIQMEYDPAIHCVTQIGWEDPRTEAGELAWPERFPAHTLSVFKQRAFMWTSQYMQLPEIRGGSIFRRDDWQVWEGKFPRFEHVVAYLDTAFATKESNDYSALTVWGLFRDAAEGPTSIMIDGQFEPFGLDVERPKIMMIYAWRGRKELHGPTIARESGETAAEYISRCKPHWGVVEWANHWCERFRVDRLLIENKARGHDVAREIQLLYANRSFGVQLDNPVKDKRARAWSVQHLFADKMVYAPRDVGATDDFQWVQMVIDEAAVFDKGAHDDLVDTMTGALRYLRNIGAAMRKDEAEYDMRERSRYRRKPDPLYPT